MCEGLSQTSLCWDMVFHKIWVRCVIIGVCREFWEALESCCFPSDRSGIFCMHSGMQVEDKAKKKQTEISSNNTRWTNSYWQRHALSLQCLHRRVQPNQTTHTEVRNSCTSSSVPMGSWQRSLPPHRHSFNTWLTQKSHFLSWNTIAPTASPVWKGWAISVLQTQNVLGPECTNTKSYSCSESGLAQCLLPSPLPSWSTLPCTRLLTESRTGLPIL